MRIVRAVNLTRGTVLAESTTVADSFLRRGWGLLGHAGLPEGEGLLITKTNSIHSFFMRFPFDAVYVDRQGAVCRLQENIVPFRLGPLVWRADAVVELPAGTIARSGTALGDCIAFEPTESLRGDKQRSGVAASVK